MDTRDLQKNWNQLGRIDPLGSILRRSGNQSGEWDLGEFFATGHREIELVMAHVESLGHRIPHGKALDFGCGVGRLTQALATHFDEVHAVDIAPSMIALAKRYNRHGTRCTYYVNSADNLGLFQDSSFAFACTSLTLQHMEPRYSKGYLRELLRILVPHGLLVFDLPELHPRALKGVLIRITPLALLRSYRQMVYRAKYRNQPVSEMHWMRRQEVVALLQRHGAKTLDITQGEISGVGWLSLRYYVAKE